MSYRKYDDDDNDDDDDDDNDDELFFVEWLTEERRVALLAAGIKISPSEISETPRTRFEPA